MSELPKYLTDEIRDGDAESGFASGVPPLDEFFAKYALTNHQRQLGRTFVLRRPDGDATSPAIFGFYTLSMAHLEVADLPDKLARGLPRYPVPVARVGRLATDARVRGRGCGAALLLDVFRRLESIVEHIGCRGVLVDAKDEAAQGFYSHYGFVALGQGGYPRPMFLAWKKVQQALSEG